MLEYLGDKNHLDDDKNNHNGDKDHQGDDKHHLSDDKTPLEASRARGSARIAPKITGRKSMLDVAGLPGKLVESQSHLNSYKFQPQLTLLGNVTTLYANQIAHNLLWHIDVEKTLAFAASNPASLLITIEIKDPHGQRVRGTPLQIMAAAGDRNPRKLKSGEKDYGLVERLRSCFPKDSQEYDKQLEDWFRPDYDKEQTKKTMARYVNAIKTLCQDIIESVEISQNEISRNVKFEDLLKLPIIEKFRKALIPDPNHVVTSGFLFDLQIFLNFFEILDQYTNVNLLGDKPHSTLGMKDGHKTHLFAAIVYPALQARAQRIDQELFIKGIWVVDKGDLPTNANFSGGIPSDFIGLGQDFFVTIDGIKLKTRAAGGFAEAISYRREGLSLFSKIISSKNIDFGLMWRLGQLVRQFGT